MGDQEKEQAQAPGKKLHHSQLATAEGITALGLHAAAQLGAYGLVCMHLDDQGFVQVARPGEHTLDALPEPEALHCLLAHGYNDEELERYLRGRDARLKK